MCEGGWSVQCIGFTDTSSCEMRLTAEFSMQLSAQVTKTIQDQ